VSTTTIYHCDQCGISSGERSDGVMPLGWMQLMVPGMLATTLCCWMCLDAYSTKFRASPPSDLSTTLEPSAEYPAPAPPDPDQPIPRQPGQPPDEPPAPYVPPEGFSPPDASFPS
jgi:hypothetical protein